jgi:hypothetical protein
MQNLRPDEIPVDKMLSDGERKCNIVGCCNKSDPPNVMNGSFFECLACVSTMDSICNCIAHWKFLSGRLRIQMATDGLWN